MRGEKPSKALHPHQKELRKRVAKAPTCPGVYKWLGEENNILYIGKAKNLRNRLKSYVQENPDKNLGPWKLSLVKHIADFDTIVTNSELEALILETNLIKECKPKYNVLMKDDKNYVYVRISLQAPYPDVAIVRRMDDDGATYFGPFVKAQDTKKILDVLQEIFNFREDKNALEKLNRAAKRGEDSAQQHPSLDFQIGQSCGVAMGKISREEYRSRIEAVADFFRGDRRTVLKWATEMMREAAQKRRFERAAKLRDAVQFIEGMQREQVVSDTSGEDTDTFAVAMSGSKALVFVLRERGGRLISEQSFSLKGEPHSPARALEQFLPQYYSAVPDLPDLVVVEERGEDADLLAMWLTKRKGKAVEVRVPERGKKSRVLKLARKNAIEKAKQLEAKWESAARNIDEALTQLEEFLHLPKKPRRIEGYDISHLGGTETVGSMVVAINGKPARKDYRSFTIQTLKERDIDDCKALEEVLRRRMKYRTANLKAEEEQWRKCGISFGRARKKEQHIIEETIEAHPNDFHTGKIEYRDFLVARKDDQIIAFAQLCTHKGEVLEMKSLWVEERQRGKRLGHTLTRALLSRAKNRKVYVTIHPSLEEYYATIGFRHVLSPPKVIQREIEEARKQGGPFREGFAMVYLPEEHRKDSSLESKPDLLLIDGGKGQVGSAVKVLKECNLDIPVIGLAKREEEIFLPGTTHPTPLPKDSQAQFLLQRIRNEAHRFANEHRKKRAVKHAIHSVLDDVPGIGVRTKQMLLSECGSVEKIKEASDEELRNFLSEAQLRALRTHL